MKRIVIVAVGAVLVLGGCTPQERVRELEDRVLALEDLVNQMADIIGTPGKSGGGRVKAADIHAPAKDCQKPGLATWEEDGTLGCTSPTNLNHVDGYTLYFPAAKGCLGNYTIMGAEGLTCDTPEHPYN